MLRMAEAKRKYEFKDKAYVWMRVTKDKYSLPLIVRNTGRELAKACGVKPNTVFHHINLHEKGKAKGYPKYIRVIVEDEDDE